MGPREVAYGPVTPAQCPSQADTCGGPDRFRHAPSIKAALNVDPGHFEAVMRPFWVNNAETWALVHDHEAGWSVWAANATEPTRGVIALTETAPAAGIGAHVIGVRWHDDLRPLLARTCEALCHAPSIATPTNDEETDDEELYFNDKCEETFQLGFTCASAAEDESCFGDGGEDEGNGGDSEDSEGGDTEDTEDAAEVVLDTRTTKELGNACFTHIKSGELTTAEAECRLALTRADNDRSRGALHYNLGLIAEARGDKAGAKSAYATSLRFRPGNQAVMDRLKALE